VHRRRTPSGDIVECPPAVTRRLGQNVPFGGGWGLRRSSPSQVLSELARRNRAGTPAVLWVHPWELDDNPPRVSLPWGLWFAHYFRLSGFRARLETILRGTRFVPLTELVSNSETDAFAGLGAGSAVLRGPCARSRERRILVWQRGHPPRRRLRRVDLGSAGAVGRDSAAQPSGRPVSRVRDRGSAVVRCPRLGGVSAWPALDARLQLYARLSVPVIFRIDGVPASADTEVWRATLRALAAHSGARIAGYEMAVDPAAVSRTAVRVLAETRGGATALGQPAALIVQTPVSTGQAAWQTALFAEDSAAYVDVVPMDLRLGGATGEASAVEALVQAKDPTAIRRARWRPLIGRNRSARSACARRGSALTWRASAHRVVRCLGC
jgi:hypothetical protein